MFFHVKLWGLDRAAAEARNRFVIENADARWTPLVNPGGMLERLLNGKVDQASRLFPVERGGAGGISRKDAKAQRYRLEAE